jgi:PAS domain-containing protein
MHNRSRKTPQAEENSHANSGQDYNSPMTSPGHGSGHPEKAEDIRLVVDTIPGLVWSTRLDGSVEFFNQLWPEYTGLSAEQALNGGWNVGILPDDVSRMMEIFHEALSLGRSFDHGYPSYRPRFSRPSIVIGGYFLIDFHRVECAIRARHAIRGYKLRARPRSRPQRLSCAIKLQLSKNCDSWTQVQVIHIVK